MVTAVVAAVVEVIVDAAAVVVVVGLEPLKMVAIVAADAAIPYHCFARAGANYLMTALALVLG